MFSCVWTDSECHEKQDCKFMGSDSQLRQQVCCSALSQLTPNCTNIDSCFQKQTKPFRRWKRDWKKETRRYEICRHRYGRRLRRTSVCSGRLTTPADSCKSISMKLHPGRTSKRSRNFGFCGKNLQAGLQISAGLRTKKDKNRKGNGDDRRWLWNLSCCGVK